MSVRDGVAAIIGLLVGTAWSLWRHRTVREIRTIRKILEGEDEE